MGLLKWKETEEEAESGKTALLLMRISAVRGKTKQDPFLILSQDVIEPTPPQLWKCSAEPGPHSPGKGQS